MAADREHWVARPGELIAAGGVPVAATRAGGLPLFPPGCPTPDAGLTACKQCGQQAALILQAHAPLEAEQTGGAAQPHRFLYLFGCVAEGCGKQPGCWRALRVTAPPGASPDGTSGTAAAAAVAAAVPPQQQHKQQQEQQQEQQPAPMQPADDWGVSGADDWGASGAADDWGGGAAAGSASGAAFDFGDLDAALDAVGGAQQQQAAAAKAPPGKSQQQQQQQEAGGAAGSVYDAARPSLPAFYLYAQPESACSGSSHKEEAHLAELLARYEAEAAAASGSAASGGGGGDAAAAAAGACLPSVEGGGEAWGGEAYEEDSVLAPGGGAKPGVGPPYLKFARRLGRCPDQCARYSFGGAPLWPCAAPPAPPPPCPACGGPRTFELQLMTPLIHALHESADWLAAGGSVAAASAAAAASLQPPDSWEWLTVCVYSCAASCGGGGGGGRAAALVEESTALANEE